MKPLAFTLFLFAALALPAQTPSAPSSSATARVIFERRWPDADPQWFEILCQPDGSARYRSLPHQDAKPAARLEADPHDPTPEPYELSFTLSPRSRQLIFALAPQLPRLQGSLDRVKVAFTGSKTLRYDDGSGNVSVITYNISSSRDLTAFTELMQAISESIELSQSLHFQLRFDRLALDSTLRRAEDLVSFHRLAELQLLQPVLQRIADDPTVMNIARQRARRIMQTAPASIPR